MSEELPSLPAVPEREITVLIPTFNRRSLVVEAVASAAVLLAHADAEILVVDDASRDGTDDALCTAFPDLVATERLRIVVNASNLGVTGTRNVGAHAAEGEWLLCLDSDDLLRAEAVTAVVEELRAQTAPLVFFRCVDVHGRLIGDQEASPREIRPRDLLLAWRWGECLPVIRRSACRRVPYDADLNGVEGLTYARVARALGPARLSTIVARTYREEGADRLSSRAGVRARSCELARGHLRTLREFRHEFDALGTVRQVGKVAYHAMNCLRGRAGLM